MIIDATVTRLLAGHEDADYSNYMTDYERAMKKAIDEKIAAMFEQHVAPIVSKQVDEICLQSTNAWGEKTGKPVTFIEYLTARADAYMREKVNYCGKSQTEDTYGWREHSTRISYLIHEHLSWSIRKAMEQALGTVNSSVRKGLEEAVKIALAGITVTVNTEVKTP